MSNLEGKDAYSSANFFSKLNFFYLRPFIKKAKKTGGVDFKDLDNAPKRDRMENNNLNDIDFEPENPDAGFIGKVIKRQRSTLFLTGTLTLLNIIVMFMSPKLLEKTLIIIQTGQADSEFQQLLYYAGGFFLLTFLQVYFQYFRSFMDMRVGLRVMSGLVGLVFQSVLRMSNKTKSMFSSGYIVNLIGNDSQMMQRFCWMLHQIWSSPVTIGVAVYQLYQLMGWSAIWGILSSFLILPFMIIFISRLTKTRMKYMAENDRRVKKLGELLKEMNSVKFNSWEEQAEENIEEIRSVELGLVQKLILYFAKMMFFFTMTPSIMPLIAFGFYVTLTGNAIIPSVAFTSFTYFNMLLQPLQGYSRIIEMLINAKVAGLRMKKLVCAAKREDVSAALLPDDDLVLDIKDASFQYESLPDNIGETMDDVIAQMSKKRGCCGKSAVESEDELDDVLVMDLEPFSLKNINLTVRRGEFVGIVSRSAQGKSSLLSAVIGNMTLKDGSFSRCANTMIAPQTPYIVNASIRDNILFGLPLDKSRYDEAVRRAALSADFSQLAPDDKTSGDLVEIGDKGVGISGGQKARVALARALYWSMMKPADENCLLLIDDYLSAVDARVGEHLRVHAFEYLKEMKRGCVLATHHVYALEFCDRIVVLKEGSIEAEGSFTELMENDEFRLLLQENDEDEGEENTEREATPVERELLPMLERPITWDVDNPTKATSILASIKSDGDVRVERDDSKVLIEFDANKMTSAEEKMEGAVSGAVWKAYLGGFGSFWFWFWIVVIVGTYMTTSILSNFSLVWWTEDPMGDPWYYIWLFGGLSMASVLLLYIFQDATARAGVRSAGKLHRSLLRSVLTATYSFFSNTPVGRIINRFSGDVLSLDTTLQIAMLFFVLMIVRLIVNIAVIISALPIILLLVIPIVFILLWYASYYRVVARDLRRLVSISKSPMLSHLNETIDGMGIIQIGDFEDQYLDHMGFLMNRYSRAAIYQQGCSSWISSRFTFIGAIIFACVALVIAFFNISASWAGVALSNSQGLIVMLGFALIMFSELEAAMACIERIYHYTNNIPLEPDFKDPKPPVNWPLTSDIVFDNVSARYRQDLEDVLKDLSFTINDKERVAIVGTTGSGKTTIFNVLFRLITDVSGDIVISGVKTDSIGIGHLRRIMAAVPQNPSLFEGTLRKNIDYFGMYTDEEISEAVDKIGLADLINVDLDQPISESGGNLSSGIRQLICLTRVLLDKSKRILILDECSSSLDAATDSKLQRVIREEFKDFTICTIAHRLHTIIDYDRVLLLDEGRKVEYDNPATLLADESSSFSSLVDRTGPQEAARLRRMVLGLPTPSPNPNPTNTL
ncbi:hypothetical protein PCE1_003911 [Barthelona sp. PCE]